MTDTTKSTPIHTPVTGTSQQASKHGGTFGHGPAAVGVLGSQAVHELPGPGKLLRGAIRRKCAVTFDYLLCPDCQGIICLGEFDFHLQSTSGVTEPVSHTCGGRQTDTTEELSVKARRGFSHTSNMHMCTDQFIAGYQGSVHWKSQLSNHRAPDPPGFLQGTNYILFCRNYHPPRPTYSHAVIPNSIWG